MSCVDVFLTWLCVRDVECEPARVVKFPAVSQKHRFLSDSSTLNLNKLPLYIHKEKGLVMATIDVETYINFSALLKLLCDRNIFLYSQSSAE